MYAMTTFQHERRYEAFLLKAYFPFSLYLDQLIQLSDKKPAAMIRSCMGSLLRSNRIPIPAANGMSVREMSANHL